MDRDQTLESLLLYADERADEPGIAPPLYQGVPFSAESAEQFAEMNAVPQHERFYRRYGNPTQARFEAVVAAIEGAEAALATASGMGAISTTLLTFLSAGDHVVAQRSLYGGTLSLLRTIAPRLGITTTFVDQTDTQAFEHAVTPQTRLVLLESPSNPLLQITDLAAVADLARSREIMTIIDSTVATPVNQRPLDCGIDLVIHSATKSLSGHSDVLAGVVTGRRDLIERIWDTHVLIGSVVSPLDAWLALRGMRTLSMRVAWQNATALAVAEFLDAHPAVARVNYPGLKSHPQHELADRQMKGFGGLLSFELRGGFDAAENVIAALRRAARSSSLGGVRSLVVQPAALWGESLSEEELAEAGVPAGLVRYSVGLEPADELIADLEQALGALP